MSDDTTALIKVVRDRAKTIVSITDMIIEGREGDYDGNPSDLTKAEKDLVTYTEFLVDAMKTLRQR